MVLYNFIAIIMFFCSLNLATAKYVFSGFSISDLQTFLNFDIQRIVSIKQNIIYIKICTK